MIHPLFTVDMLQRLYVFFSILDFIKALRSIYQNVQYFIRSKNRLNLNLLQLDILCTSAVKRNYTKLQFTVYVSPVFQCIGVRGSKKTCHRVARTSIWSVPYSGELYNKKCIVKTPVTLIICSTSCYTAGSK